MLPILMMLAAPTAAQTSSPMTLPQSVLHTPDMISPAVLPYLACLYGIHGLPVLKGNDGNEIAFDKNDSNCSATKRRAKTEALKLIADKSVPGSATLCGLATRGAGADDHDRGRTLASLQPLSGLPECERQS